VSSFVEINPFDGNKTAVLVNLRSQSAGLTGVQRYAQELCRRLNDLVEPVIPRQSLHGVKGHLWEQMVLPRRVKGQLLWSPANTGPIAISRQVLTVHDVASLDHPEWFEPRFAGWYQWMTPKLVKRVCRVITVSEFSKRRLIELTGIPESRVVVIPNGVDGRFHSQGDEEICRVRRKLRIPSDRYVLSLGSIEPRKNLATLLKAWRVATRRLAQEFWLVVAGVAGSGHVFHGTGIESVPDRVMFTGFVNDEDLPGLYSGATALAYPSMYEGFGLPALEAMASGCVPIAANSTALPEVVGDAGILVNPTDIEELAQAIIKIAEDTELRAALRARGIARSAEFSWERAADSTKRVLTEVCPRARLSVARC
jgi:glycosyltransferase involved in cell wall biosynthesis